LGRCLDGLAIVSLGFCAEADGGVRQKTFAQQNASGNR
jgi:hypothetical protein